MKLKAFAIFIQSRYTIRPFFIITKQIICLIYTFKREYQLITYFHFSQLCFVIMTPSQTKVWVPHAKWFFYFPSSQKKINIHKVLEKQINLFKNEMQTLYNWIIKSLFQFLCKKIKKEEKFPLNQVFWKNYINVKLRSFVFVLN